MHTIAFCAATSSSTDAGCRSLAIPISTVPIHFPKTVHVGANDLKAPLDVQIINPDEDTPVATSPVPMKSPERVEDPALHNRRKARISLEDLALAEQASLLKHVRTLDRLGALAMLEGRKAGPVQEELILSGWEVLEEARAFNRLEAFDILEGRNTCTAQEDLVLAVSRTSSLKRVGAIGKKAGLDILQHRESRKARFFGGSSLQALLRP